MLKRTLLSKYITHFLISALAVLTGVGLAACSASADEVTHIKVGNDQQAHSADLPFIQVKSIDDLQTVLDRLGSSHKSAQLDIEFAPGTHHLARPIQLSHQRHSFARLRFHGRPNAAPTRVVGVLSFDLTHKHNKIASATIPLTAAQTDGYLNQSYGFGKRINPHLVQVFSNGNRIAPMRWPLEMNTKVVKVTDRGDYFVIVLATPAKGAALWPALAYGTAVRLNGYFVWTYAFESVPATIVGEREVKISKSGLRYGIKAGAVVFLENVLSLGDRPGFVVDQVSNLLRVTAQSDAIEIPTTERFLYAQGISNLTIENLELFGFTGDAVVLQDAEKSDLNNLTISGIGNRAVVIKGNHVSVRNCRFVDLGEGGVFIAGGSRTDRSRGENVVNDTLIERFDALAHTYRPAVEIEGVGNSVINNKLVDGNHTAIMFSGNDHTISNNRIERVIQEGQDSGAIYAGRDWTSYGTVIEGNIFESNHNAEASNGSNLGFSPNTMGIYLDDGISGIIIRDNIFIDTPWAVFINGGKDNRVSRNIFVRSNPAIGASAYLLGHPEYLRPNSDAQAVLSDLAGVNSVLLRQYPQIWQNRFSSEILKPTGNILEKNVFLNSTGVMFDNSKTIQFYSVSDNVPVQVSRSSLASFLSARQNSNVQTIRRELCEIHHVCVNPSP